MSMSEFRPIERPERPVERPVRPERPIERPERPERPIERPERPVRRPIRRPVERPRPMPGPIINTVTEPIICLGDEFDEFRVKGIKNGGYYLFGNYNTNLRWRDNNDGTITIYDINYPLDVFRIDKAYTRDARGQCRNGINESRGFTDDKDFLQTLRRTFTNNGGGRREYFHDMSNDVMCSTILIIILIVFIIYVFYNKDIVYKI